VLSNIDPLLLIGVVLAAVLGHVVLLVAARWVNVVFLVCAAFLVASPLSVATDFGQATELIKWGRVYLSLLMIVAYVAAYRTFRLGPAGLAFLVFLGFYTVAGVWSSSPLAAIAFKGLYGIVVVGGVLMASSIRDFSELRTNLRILLLAAAFYGLIVLAGLAREPGALLSGRLQIWGWNTNRLGHDAAAMIAISFFVGLYDTSRTWKIAGLAMAGFFGVIVLGTGSRAAAGMTLLCSAVMAAPMFRRPVLLSIVILLGGLLLNFVSDMVAKEATQRLGDMSFSNRWSVWNSALDTFHDNMIIGAGWVADTTRRAGGATANLHSIYIQILAETGLVGAALFLAMLVICGMRALVLLNIIRKVPGTAPYAFFAFALAGATLAHGAAESSTLQGTNLNGLLLPFAVGLLDRLPQMIREAGAAQAEADEEYAIDADGEYIPYGEDPEPA
jgi:hypothetical protein